MVATVLLTAGSSLVTISVVPYIKDIIRGKAKPRFISWSIWAILLGLTAIVSWQEGQTASAVLASASALGCFWVAMLAVRHLSLKLTHMEYFTLIGAVIGIVLWLIFDDPMLVLLTAVTVDGIAFLPTYVNGWRNPQHESLTMFAVSGTGSALVLAAAITAQATSSGLVYPIYSVTFTGIMIGILLARRPRNNIDHSGSLRSVTEGRSSI